MTVSKSFSHEVLRKVILAPLPENPNVMLAILDRADPKRTYGVAYPIPLIAPPLQNLLAAAPFMYQELCRYYDTMQMVVDAIDKAEAILPGVNSDAMNAVRQIMEQLQEAILNVQATIQNGIPATAKSVAADKSRKPT